MKTAEHVLKARKQHHAALLALASFVAGTEVKTTGLALWRKLARIERNANQLATEYCNGLFDTEAMERHDEVIKSQVAAVFGGKLPPGFFFNKDPRGYALKLEEGSVPFALHEDWGRYQILAPIID